MKTHLKYFVITFLVLSLGTILLAQEEKKGKPLVFPKEAVEDNPSDLHMGSDPYYDPATDKDKYEGSDEQCYPTDVDPQLEYHEKRIEIKKIKKN